MNYEQRVTEIIVMPEGAGLIGEQATRINLVDEGAGEFVIVEQESGSIRIDPEEWPTIKQAIDRMIGAAAVIEQEHGHD